VDLTRCFDQEIKSLESALAEAGERDEFAGRRLVLNTNVAILDGWSATRKLSRNGLGGDQ
jgi:hypothetical protein